MSTTRIHHNCYGDGTLNKPEVRDNNLQHLANMLENLHCETASCDYCGWIDFGDAIIECKCSPECNKSFCKTCTDENNVVNDDDEISDDPNLK